MRLVSWLVSHQPVVSQIVRESVNYFSDHLGNWPVNKLIISQLFRKSVIKLVSQSVVSCRSDNLSELVTYSGSQSRSHWSASQSVSWSVSQAVIQ